MRAVVVALVIALTAATARADEVWTIVGEGDALADEGDRRGALARYERALAIDPDRLAIYDRAIPLWIAEEAWPSAIAWLEKATLRAPAYAAGWYALGYVYRRTGRTAAAVGAYEEYVQLRPDDAAGWFGLAVAAERVDQREVATRAYRRYLAREHDPARAPYRAQARAAIERLTPPPATWRDALSVIVAGRGTIAAWLRFAEAP